MADQRLIVETVLQDRNLNKGLREAAKSVDGFSERVKKSRTQVRKSRLELAAWTAGLGLGAREIARFGLGQARAMVDAASQTEELQSRFEIVFGSMTDSVRAWAEETGDELGRSSVKIEGFLASVQDTLVPLGLAEDQAADLSKTFAQLSIDLASFDPQTRSAEEALQLMTSALVGNHEAVRRFGSSITQSRIDNYARQLGLATKELTEQQKVAIRAALIIEDTAAAHNNASVTADSYKNTMASLSDAMFDVRAEAGREVKVAILDALEEHGGPGELARDVAVLADAFASFASSVVSFGSAAAHAAKHTGDLLDLVGSGAAEAAFEAFPAPPTASSSMPAVNPFMDMTPVAGESPFSSLGGDASFVPDQHRTFFRMLAEAGRAWREEAVAISVATEGADQATSAYQQTLDSLVATLSTGREENNRYTEEIDLGRAAVNGFTLSIATAAAEVAKLGKLQLDHQRRMEELRPAFAASEIGVDNFASAIANAARTSRLDFGDMTRSIIADLAFLQARFFAIQGLTTIFPSLALNPAFAGAFGLFGKGAAFGPGGSVYSAHGRMLDGPTAFSHGGGVAVGGELGRQTEGLFPVRRMSNGDLGVQATGAGGGHTLNLTINAIDTQTGASFVLENSEAIAFALIDAMNSSPALKQGIQG